MNTLTHNLATAYRQRGAVQEDPLNAITDFETARAISPDPQDFYNLAVAYERLGNTLIQQGDLSEQIRQEAQDYYALALSNYREYISQAGRPGVNASRVAIARQRVDILEARLNSDG